MNYATQAQSLLEKAFTCTKNGSYDLALQWYDEALVNFTKYMKSLPRDQQSQLEQNLAAIKEERQTVQQINECFKPRQKPQQNIDFDRCSDDDEVFDSPQQCRRTPAMREADKRNLQQAEFMKTPSKWNNNAAKPIYQQRNDSRSQPKVQNNYGRNGSRQDYDKPWRQNPSSNVSRPNNGYGNNSNAKNNNGARNQNSNNKAKYPGVEEQYVPMIEQLMLTDTHVSFADIAGLDNAKQILKEAIIWPMKTPAFYKNIKPTKGILLQGPPGTGKTQIAKAIATEAGCTFFAPTSATIMNKMVGDSEKVVQALFKIAEYNAPSIIFIDEIDALLSAGTTGENDVSKRIRQEFLTQMEGVTSNTEFDVKKHVLVIGATNHPYKLDEALRRRLQKRVLIPMPEYESRLAMLKLFIGSQKYADDVNFEQIAKKLDGYNGSDIRVIVQDAMMASRRRLFEKYDEKQLIEQQEQLATQLIVTGDDFNAAIARTKPSVSQKDIDDCNKFQEEFAAD